MTTLVAATPRCDYTKIAARARFVKSKGRLLPDATGGVSLVHIMNNKNVWKRADPFTGDLAAFVLYSDVLTEQEKQAVRGYFDSVYDFKNASASGQN